MSIAPLLFTMSIWQRCVQKYSLSSPCPLLSNILFNPVLPDSLSLGRMWPWLQASLFQLLSLLHHLTRRLQTFATLQDKFGIPHNSLYFYIQVKHFFQSMSPFLTIDKPTPFEHICADGPHQLHLVSSIYHILHEATLITEDRHLYMRKWNTL